MSNGFEKSKMITSTCFFWSMLRFISSVVTMSCDPRVVFRSRVGNFVICLASDINVVLCVCV